jgi:hypothetical protein
MGMERPGTISAIVLTKTALVLADRYSGVNPLGVLYLSHRVVALIFFHGFSAIRADFS